MAEFAKRESLPRHPLDTEPGWAEQLPQFPITVVTSPTHFGRFNRALAGAGGIDQVVNEVVGVDSGQGSGDWDANREQTSGRQDPGDLIDETTVVASELQHILANDGGHRRRWKRQRRRVREAGAASNPQEKQLVAGRWIASSPVALNRDR